ncbi:MAG: AAA family ATPase [Acidimicrobiales bacterium]
MSTWFDPLATPALEIGPTVSLGADDAGALGVAEGGSVRLCVEGRRLLARARLRPGGGGLGIDRRARPELRPFPYEPVEVTALDLAGAERVTVAGVPGAAVDEAISAAAAGGWPVCAGTVLGTNGPDLYVVAVTPPDAIWGSATEVVVESDDAGSARREHGGHGRLAAARHGATGDPGEPGFEDVGGLARQVAAVRELVELPLLHPEVYAELGIQAPRGVLFCGPPGTGKTLTARAAATEMEASFYRVSGPEVVGSYSGQTEENLRRLFADAQRSAPSVILVDEVDALAPARRNASTMSDSRSVGQLLALMDGLRNAAGVVVIGTTNQVEALDPALRRPGRFDRELHFASPGAAERLEILRIHVRGMPLSRAAAQSLPEVAGAAHGFVGADLMELAREAGLGALRRGAFLGGSPRVGEDQLVVEADDLRAALAAIRPAALRQSLLDDATTTMDDIAGYHHVKQRLVEIGRLAVGASAGRTVGVLLEGPPGTGKTLLAQALAAELDVNLVVARGPELYSQWLGESEAAVRQLFAVARRSAPVVLVIDQLDALAPRRELAGADPTRASQRVVGQLLAEFDVGAGLHCVLVVGVTSRPDDVDPSVRRPGRIGLRVRMDLPDAQDRRYILELFLARAGIRLGSWDSSRVQGLVSASAGLSGADLAMACELAGLAASRRGPGTPIDVGDVDAGLRMLDPRSLGGDGCAHDPTTLDNASQ